VGFARVEPGGPDTGREMPPAAAAGTMPLGAPLAGVLPALREPGEGPVPACPPPGPWRAGPAGLLAATARRMFATVVTDPRLPWWIRRVVLTATAATLLTVVLDWRAALTGALVTAAADTLYCGRVSAVIPPTVRVSSAQRRTRRRLGRLSASGYLSLHARVIPGSGSVIDHLVAGPAGVYVIDSQRWDRRLPVRATQGAQLFHGPFDQSGRVRHARWEADQAAMLLGEALGQPVTVRPAMVIYGPTVPWVVAKIGGVDVFGGRRLRKYLRRESGASRGRQLGERQIELIHAVAAQALPPAR
jgi:nuclease-like protein